MINHQSSDLQPKFFFSQNLSEIDGLCHGFFTRHHGISTGIYASLNCGSGSNDNKDVVNINRARVADSLGLSRLISLRQTHSNRVVEITEQSDLSNLPNGDGMITRRSGIGLGVLTADCIPVLFADTRARVIAAAHAGWKGANNGVIEAVLTCMLKMGVNQEDIVVAIGPGIQQRSYQVDVDFKKRIEESATITTDDFFKHDNSDAGKFLFDLPGFIEGRLREAGVINIERLHYDTYGLRDTFFSYRRAVHQNQKDYGRQVSVIGLL